MSTVMSPFDHRLAAETRIELEIGGHIQPIQFIIVRGR